MNTDAEDDCEQIISSFGDYLSAEQVKQDNDVAITSWRASLVAWEKRERNKPSEKDKGQQQGKTTCRRSTIDGTFRAHKDINLMMTLLYHHLNHV